MENKQNNGIKNTIFASIIASLAVFIISNNISKTEASASETYVDQKIMELKKEVDQKADKTDIIKLDAKLTIIDGRIYDLWKSSKTNQK